MQKPYFSIITPTYNRPEQLNNAILSVLDQSFENFEHIIVDDNSVSATEKIIAAIGDKRLKYIRRTINGGPAAARNTGIKYASGEFICFLDDDDVFLSEMLQHLYDMFQADNELEFVWTGISRLEKKDKQEVEFRRNVGPRYYEDGEEGLAMASSIAAGFGLCIKKSCFNKIGFFDESLKFGEDTDMVIRLAKSCKFGTVPKVLVKIYQHQYNQLSDMRFHIENYEIYRRIIQKHYNFLSKHPKVMHMHLKAFTKICYHVGKKSQGRKMYLKLIMKFPFYRILYADLLCYEIVGTHYAEWLRERRNTRRSKKSK